MAEITRTGIAATGLAEYIARFQQEYRAVFGAALEFETGSVQQQQIGVLSTWGSIFDDGLISVANAQSLENAVDYQLDEIGYEHATLRREATATTVQLTLGGVAGTALSVGRRVQTAAGVIFRTDADVTIGSTGSVVVQGTAVVDGLQPVAAGAINQIVDVISGWETVNNITAGVTGRNREVDVVYRERIRRQTRRNALSSLDAIDIAVQEVHGVSKTKPLENDEAAPAVVDGVTIAAHSVYMVVQGGVDDDVALAIYNARSAGTPTDGSVTVNIPRGNWTVELKFSRPTETPISVNLTIDTIANFPSDGIARIQQALLDLVADLDIGEPLYDSDVYVPILSISGFRVVGGTLALARLVGADLVTTVNGDELFTLALTDITVTTT